MAVARGFLLAIGITALAPVAAAQPAPTPPPPSPAAAPPPVEPVADDPPTDPAAGNPEREDPVRALEQRLEDLTAHLARVEALARANADRANGTDGTDRRTDVDARTPDGDDDLGSGFRFGSYGRVIAGTNLRGGKPEPIHVVAHGPRIVEKSYLELDFTYGHTFPMSGVVRTVTTLAFDDRLFHDTGAFDQGLAIRNFYAEAVLGDFHAWVGSRMLRGDDLYLFDFWPLDDLNTLGGGLGVESRGVEVSVHAGLNRLQNDFQFQDRQVAEPELGATTVVQLNRQRFITSARASYTRTAPPTQISTRARLYAEVHGLPSGQRRRTDATVEALPSDWGTTIGAELSAWGLAAQDSPYSRHANLFVRWSKGLAAFDELAKPLSFDNQLETFANASEIVVGLGANWDDRWGHVTFATYARRFVDADRETRDRDDGWEYAIDVRPALAIKRGLHAAVDLAYEVRFPRGLQPTTQVAADPAIVSIAPMLTFAPTGPSAFDRPELRLVYRAAHQNAGALALYPATDPRAITWTHFLGLEAEWWFNSSSYR